MEDGRDVADALKMLPRSIADPLERRRETAILPPITIRCDTDGHVLNISVVLIVSQFEIDVPRRKAYFPITVGLWIAPEGELTLERYEDFAKHPLSNPANWKPEDLESFWNHIIGVLEKYQCNDEITPKPKTPKAVLNISAQVMIPVEPSDVAGRNQAVQMVIDSFIAKGDVIKFDWHWNHGANLLSRPSLEPLVDAVDNAQDSDQKGKALEELISKLLLTIPGFKISARVHTKTEEIDLWIENGSDYGFLRQEGHLILAECKNWSQKCGKNELVPFLEKIRNRRKRCKLGIFISWRGFTDTFSEELLRGSKEPTLVIQLERGDLISAAKLGAFFETLDAGWKKAVAS